MFRKIKVDWHVEDYTYGKKIVEYGVKITPTKLIPKIVYHEATGQCEQLLGMLIPERYKTNFTVSIMDLSSGVGPHTDSGILTTINHYIQTNDEQTIFYKVKPEIKINTTQIKNQTNGAVFNHNQLDIHGSFVAKANETWLLDVTKPHSVVSVKPTSSLRKAIVIQTNVHTYDEVIEFLYETQSL